MRTDTLNDAAFRAYLYRWNLRTLYEYRLDALANGRLTIEQFHQLCDAYREEFENR